MAVTVLWVLVLLVYARGWLLLAREKPGQVMSWRLGSFFAGMAMAWIAWSVRADTLTHYLLTAHMVQHLLFVLAAPPLLLLGAPAVVLWRGLRGKAGASPFSRSPRTRTAWASRVWRLLTHPIFAGTAMVAITIFWHIPAVFAVAMHSAAWHNVENATFLTSGVLFWWPVILPWPSTQHWPRWAIPLYLLGADMPVSVLSAYLAFCGHVVYPAYLLVPRPFAISALNDQVAAAMLMWVAMLLVFLAAAVAVLLELLDPSWQLGPEPEMAVVAETADLWQAVAAQPEEKSLL